MIRPCVSRRLRWSLRPVRAIRPSSATIQPLSRFSSSKPDLDNLVPSEPTWSVQSLLPSEGAIGDPPAITSAQLHHLLRLSALPPPQSQEEESTMLKTLASQLHFVRDIQNVDTAGVDPLRSIRDETAAAEKAEEISLESLREALDAEEHVGKYHRRIRRRTDVPVDTAGAEDWDALAHTDKKASRYFVVDSKKD